MQDDKPELEIDFKKVLKNPSRWFGTIYPYFIILIIAAGIFYVKNLENFTKNTIPPANIDTSKGIRDIAESPGKVIAGIELARLAKPDDSLLAKGKSLFAATCSSCHGVEGSGDGAAGSSLNPKPRNFHEKEGWVNGRSLSEMYETLQKGIPGSGMAAFEYMSPEDLFAVIYYIRTMAYDFPKVEEIEITALDAKYSLSKGKVKPPQIPIEKALLKITEERRSNIAAMHDKFRNIQNEKSQPGAKIFMESTKNPIRALYYLSKSDEWKNSPENFAKYLSKSIPQNGFKPEILIMGKNEITELFSYLREKRM